MNIYLKTLFLTDSHLKQICHLWLSYFMLVKPVFSCKYTKIKNQLEETTCINGQIIFKGSSV